MKKLTRLTLLMALSLCAFAPAVRAGDTSLTGYATYWEAQDHWGGGGGCR
jgi:hypothetical protein